MTVENRSGTKFEFEYTIEYMNDEIREKLHNELAPCTEQEFFTAYENEHEKSFGVEWELSKKNPVW